jgi:signal peptidase I
MKGGEDMENDDSKVLPVENMNTEARTAELDRKGVTAEEVKDASVSEAEGNCAETLAQVEQGGDVGDTQGDKATSIDKPANKKRTARTRVKGEASSRKKKEQAIEVDVDISEVDLPKFSTVDIDESEAQRLEDEAIAALPHAESLDSLIYDSYEDSDSHESAEELESYESFLAEYKRVISEALTYSSEKDADTETEYADSGESEKDTDSADTGSIDAENSGYTDAADTGEAEENGELLENDGGEFSEDTAEQLEMELVVPTQESVASPDDSEIPPEDEDAPEYNPEKPRMIDSIFDFVELFVFTLLAVMVLTSFFFRNSIVDGDSMNGTLKDGEHLIISDVFYTPERGDIIVFEDFTIDTTAPLVKRVIAVSGDMIRVTGGKVYVNEELVTEDYVSSLESRKDVPLMTVPEGEVFVMGDNRGDSHDSRDFGTVSEDSILGKVILRFYPFDKFGKVE